MNISNLDFYRNAELRPIYSKYFMRLLIDNRLNDFYRITEINQFIKNCQFKIENNFKPINCTPGDFGIKKTRF